MADDLFGYDAQYKGIGLITAKNMILKVAGSSTRGTTGEYLVQNVAINYQQPIQIIREISTGNAYYHALPPQGSLSIARIVGRRSIALLLGPPGTGVWTVPGAGEDEGGESRLAVLESRQGQGGLSYKMYGCITENFTANADANSSFVQESVVLRFGKMSEG